ncbi:MAG: hypothetical protein JWQ71_1637, partial [Pedosphaera sp.]|nr:hypothetical protein [Pedosphaera sp.]
LVHELFVLWCELVEKENEIMAFFRLA